MAISFRPAGVDFQQHAVEASLGDCVFNFLDSEAAAALSAIGSTRTFAKGVCVGGQGCTADTVGVVVSGILALRNTMADGKSQIVGLLFPGCFFGALLCRRHRFAVETASRAVLCCFGKASFERLMGRVPEISHAVLQQKLLELDTTREWLSLLACLDTAGRLAAFLLMILNRGQRREGPSAGSCTLTIPISRIDMADYLGTTVETISRQVHNFVDRRYIRIIDSHMLIVLDEEGLKSLSGNLEENSFILRPRSQNAGLMHKAIASPDSGGLTRRL